MKKNHELVEAKDEGIRGIFPVFYSFSTTHKILTYWKDHGGNELGRVLLSPSPKLNQQLLEMNFDLIVPIPQHQERSLKRGHASAFVVANLFSRELGISIQADILTLNESGGPKQADLNRWERKHGINPFRLNSDQKLAGVKILIVDDFITSGSTLEKAANTILREYPHCEIYAASLGWKPKTERRHSVRRRSN